MIAQLRGNYLSMKQNLKIAILMTVVTTVLLGIIYPLVVTGLAQVLFHDKANGQLIVAQRRGRRLAHYRPGIHRAGISALPTVGGRATAMMPRIPAARTSVRRTRS